MPVEARQAAQAQGLQVRSKALVAPWPLVRVLAQGYWAAHPVVEAVREAREKQVRTQQRVAVAKLELLVAASQEARGARK